MRLTNIKKSIAFLTLAILLSATNTLFALKVPALKGRVNDYANVINSADKNTIEKALENLEKQTGTQLAILTIKSLENESLEEFSLKVAESWKLGQAGKDNGVLLLVAMNERSIRIETGYGAEELLTDAKCGLIIRNVIIPEFKKGNYSEGIKQGANYICGIFTGDEEITNSDALSTSTSDDEDDWPYVILAIIIIVIYILVTFSGGGRSGGHYRGGGRSSFSSGGSHRSFSGGGGHFGGGGASGHW